MYGTAPYGRRSIKKHSLTLQISNGDNTTYKFKHYTFVSFQIVKLCVCVGIMKHYKHDLYFLGSRHKLPRQSIRTHIFLRAYRKNTHSPPLGRNGIQSTAQVSMYRYILIRDTASPLGSVTVSVSRDFGRRDAYHTRRRALGIPHYNSR